MGGAVMAIVPQTFEELQRIANTIISGGLAPASLAKVPRDNENVQEVGRRNIAAVATVLMAGAELGLPPMAALRSFTVINGKPALYADGNVAVVRRAKDADGNKIAKRISSGFEQILDGNALSDLSYAWCEAERADTGEIHREEFSIADAKLAGLWDDAETVIREVWEYDKVAKKRQPVTKTLPNDAPWHRYFKRMMLWRATGYCLRWLFADILNGMLDEHEAREIADMVDITPTSYVSAAPPRNAGPPEPPEDEGTTIDGEASDGPPAAEDPPVADSAENPDEPASAQPEPPAGTEPPLTPEEVTKFLEDLEGELAFATNEQTVEEIFDLADVQVALSGNDVAIAEAFKIKDAAIDRTALRVPPTAVPDAPPEPPPADDEQGDIFPPEPPSVK